MSEHETGSQHEAGTATAVLGPPEPQPDERERAQRSESSEDVLERKRAAERQRAARLRKRFMLWAIFPAVLALLLAAKLISMSLIGNATVASYAEGDYERALNSAQQQKIVNIFERWKAPYNTGTSYLQLGFHDEARAELESALPLADAAAQCYIRANLAIAIERQGDAKLEAGDRAAAEEFWRQALAVLEQMNVCTGGMMEIQIESHDRVQGKLNPTPQDPGGEAPAGQGGQTQQEVQELQEQQQQNQDNRQEQLEEQEQQEDDANDRPW